MTKDQEYRDLRITSVAEDGSFTTEDGWSLWCPSQGERNPNNIRPHVGDTARFYGRGIGSPVRGLTIAGQEVFYETDEDYRTRVDRERQQEKEQETAKFREERAEHDSVVAALPEPFRTRIERFQRFKGEGWRVAHEPYEVFVCQEAVKIADGFDEPEQIAAFWDADWETQREYLPSLSDGHSGNTFGKAIELAMAYQQQPEVLVKMHGALDTLVGCEKYGCWASEQNGKEPTP